MDDININFGTFEIMMPQSATFAHLKNEILKNDKKFIKSFFYNKEKINDNSLIISYPLFSAMIDKNEFEEYKKGQFRCKNCRRYLKISKWVCSHSNRCKAIFLLKKKEKTFLIINATYNYLSENKNIFFHINR